VVLGAGLAKLNDHLARRVERPYRSSRLVQILIFVCRRTPTGTSTRSWLRPGLGSISVGHKFSWMAGRWWTHRPGHTKFVNSERNNFKFGIAITAPARCGCTFSGPFLNTFSSRQLLRKKRCGEAGGGSSCHNPGTRRRTSSRPRTPPFGAWNSQLFAGIDYKPTEYN